VLYFGGGEGEKIVQKNNLGWVAQVGNFESLNTALIEISKTGKNEIQTMKPVIFDHCKKNFNLDFQMEKLIKKSVF
jgi:hypothetical protein